MKSRGGGSGAADQQLLERTECEAGSDATIGELVYGVDSFGGGIEDHETNARDVADGSPYDKAPRGGSLGRVQRAPVENKSGVAIVAGKVVGGERIKTMS